MHVSSEKCASFYLKVFMLNYSGVKQNVFSDSSYFLFLDVRSVEECTEYYWIKDPMQKCFVLVLNLTNKISEVRLKNAILSTMLNWTGINLICKVIVEKIKIRIKSKGIMHKKSKWKYLKLRIVYFTCGK